MSRTKVMVYWEGPGKWEVWERGKCRVIPTALLRWTAPGRMVDGCGGKAGYASFNGKLRWDGDGWVIAAYEGRTKEKRANGRRKHRVGRRKMDYQRAVRGKGAEGAVTVFGG